MKRAALLVLAFLAPAAWAQEPSVAAILGSHVAAESYCDSGTMAIRFETAHGFQATPFERCAHRATRVRVSGVRAAAVRLGRFAAAGRPGRAPALHPGLSYEGLRDGAVLR